MAKAKAKAKTRTKTKAKTRTKAKETKTKRRPTTPKTTQYPRPRTLVTQTHTVPKHSTCKIT
jgi:hypothetical protein